MRKLTKDQQAELLRQIVDTVGRDGEPGEPIQNVISVGMLSEGWDAKTVTHIMGLRAFSSQLLCEQVVGRGLRRTSYEVNPETGLFEPEYVNIFGVPFTFLPHEGGDGPPPPPPPPKTQVEPVAEKRRFEITWPNVARIDHAYTPVLTLDMEKVSPLAIDASQSATLVELAPIIEGKPDVTRITEITLAELGRKFRMQKIAFEAAAEVFDLMKPSWKGRREYLLAQLIGLVEKFLAVEPGADLAAAVLQGRLAPPHHPHAQHDPRRSARLGGDSTGKHRELVPIFDNEHPIRSTGDMRPGIPAGHASGRSGRT